METLSPAMVLGLVAIAGLIVLSIALTAFLILGRGRRAEEVGNLTAEVDALRDALEVAELEAHALAEERDRAAGVLEPLSRAGDAITAVWTRAPVAPPDDQTVRRQESIPILAVANLKGGVGKSTVAANLAAHFDARGERVLLIDLDHHASLTAMALGGPRAPAATGADGPPSGAEVMFEGVWPQPKALVGSFSNSEVIGAAPALADLENRLLFGWLMGRETDDVRDRVARMLLNPRVQTLYDRILIDTPPRMTLGLINGLSAATHLLIPTQLNGLAVAALNDFLEMLDALRPVPLPPRQPYRIVGMQKTWAKDRLSRFELDAIGDIERILERRGDHSALLLRDCVVANLSGFGRAAGRGLAYRQESSVRPEIDRLAMRVAAFAPSFAESPES